MRLATSRLAPALPRALPSRRAARLASPAMTRERARPTTTARAAGGAPSDPPPPDPDSRRDPPFASPTSVSVDARRFRPAPLDPTAHKGRRGKVAVIGGCAEYTGAPYFAAMAALRCGADLAHVFCAEAAAPVIKSYSPELIVHPYMRETPRAREWCGDDPEDEGPEDEGPEDEGPEVGAADASSHSAAAKERRKRSRRDALRARAADLAFADVAEWLPRMDAVVVGPGLGRDWVMLETAARVVRHVLAENADIRRRTKGNAPPETTVVVDADGLHALLRHREGRCFRELETLSRRAAATMPPSYDDEDPSPTMPPSSSSSDEKHEKRRRVDIETRYAPALALVVTPNKNERERMLDARRPGGPSFDLDDSDAPPSRAPPFAGEADEDQSAGEDQSAARYLLAFGATVVNKGARDEVRTTASTAGAFGPTVLLETDVAARGAPRRCGGQGDVVSGAVAAFLAAERTRRSSGDHPRDDDDGESEGDDTYGVSPLRLRRHLAAVGGCLVTRAAARRAFEKRKLATLAGDVVEELGPAMEEAWPVGGDGEDGDEATRT
jgi:NAD(P)H-hydrate repair Nnr-like enzyme with NAD(P)H-hydrate dehydratase domain